MIETPRLVLREMNLDDLDFVADMLAHPEVMRFFGTTYSREDTGLWIERQRARYATDGHGYWLVQDRSEKRLVGQAGLLKLDLDGIDEIGLGYLIHHPFWGKGLATEAAAACRDYAFQQLAATHLVCPIRPENRPSQRVARKIGMKPGRLTAFAGFDHLIFSMARTTPENPDGSGPAREMRE